VADLYVVLLHHPVVDKNGAVVTTAVTNLDVHDIARTSRTFGVRAFYVSTPVATLRRLVDRIIRHWEIGPGAAYNANRTEALARVRQAPELDAVITEIERETGQFPRLVATTARGGPDRLSYPDLGRRLAEDGPPELLIFGTGWGLTQEILDRSDDVLEPIPGFDAGDGSYNHLSVRSAAAIILDRVRNPR